MDWGTFRALEIFAVLYDIQIDEEQYDAGACRLLGDDGEVLAREALLESLDSSSPSFLSLKPWERKTVALHGLDSVVARIDKIEVKDGMLGTRVSGWDSSAIPEWEDIDSSWKTLLAAKRLRAELMQMGQTAADNALDRIAEDLLRAMPAIPDFVTRPQAAAELRESLRGATATELDQVSEPLSQLLVRVLYLLEASSCYLGYHSVAHAEEALTLLKTSLESLGLDKNRAIGQSPYEQVALYDKAMGEMHILEYENAADSFRNVARDTGIWDGDVPRDVYCFTKPAEEDPAGLKFFRWVDCRPIFEHYVGVQAVLQVAEALNKLQRSHEALQCLRLLAEDPASPGKVTGYLAVRKSVLEFRFKRDHKEPMAPPNLPEEFRDARRLAGQVESCKVRAIELDDLTGGDLLKLGSLLSDRAKNVALDSGEFDEVLLEWAKGVEKVSEILERRVGNRITHPLGEDFASILGSANDYLSLELPEEDRWDTGSTFFEAAYDLASDRQHREHRRDIRQRVLDGAWLMFVCAQQLLRETEASKSLLTSAKSLLDTAGNQVEMIADGFSRDKEKGIPVAERATLRSEFVANNRRHIAKRGLLPVEETTERRTSLRQFLVETLLLRPGQSGDRSAQAADFAACDSCDRLCVPPRGSTLCGPLRAAACVNPALTETCDGLDPGLKDGPALEHYWDAVVEKNNDLIDAQLRREDAPDTPSGWGLAVLQRWNSFTPAMASSEGGGYLLTRHSPKTRSESTKDGQPPPSQEAESQFGLAIDPGYGFVKNLLAEGYGLRHITAVAITHDHPDHLADFEALHNLLIEYNKRPPCGRRQQVDLMVSRAALEHIGVTAASGKVVRDTIVLAPPAKGQVFPADSYLFRDCKGLQLQVTKALHQDVSGYRGQGHDSIGVLVTVPGLPGRNGAGSKIGFPSDTAWEEDIAEAYSDCDIVCLHLGSMSKRKHRLLDFLNHYELDGVLESTNHLYVPGVLWFLERLGRPEGREGASSVESGSVERLTKKGVVPPLPPIARKLVILSELGEELGQGIRVKLAEALDLQHHAVSVVPGDVGLLIDPLGRSIRCSCCERFYGWDTTDFKFELYGDSEQVFYVCPSCDVTLSCDRKTSIFQRKQTPLMRSVRAER